ncbi:MAG TPA: Xaa-Pro peptidase family protein [Candidatus Limnocylindrales bacterium]
MSAGPAIGDRLGRAQAGLRSSGADALLLGLGADLRYLTGYRALALERLTLLVLPATGRPTLVAPRLEAAPAVASPAAAAGLVVVAPWEETDDPYRLVADRLAGADGSGRLLVDTGLAARHLLELQRVLPGRSFGLATEVMGPLRAVKDAGEIELLRTAAHAADRVVDQIAAGPLIGRSEADVSREVRDRLVAEGHDVASFAIVASGPNGASPHHEAGDRRIEPGDPIVFDIGGTVGGYGSDITRMVWVTGPDSAHAPTPAFLAAFDLVRRAIDAATAAVRPGARCGDLDEVARRVIRDGGHGDAFIHRLGHGIGLEAHEEPYLLAGNGDHVEPGNTFSIEPGVYLPGQFGIRIEDIVACTEAGADVLNEAPRDLRVVAG